MTSDGVLHTAPIPPDLDIGWEGLARSVTDLASHELELTLQSGESVTLELGWPDGGDRPPANRSIIYLDQNHWITLAQLVHAPDRIRGDVDRDAAEALEALVRTATVILPLSAAHLTETPRPVGTAVTCR